MKLVHLLMASTMLLAAIPAIAQNAAPAAGQGAAAGDAAGAAARGAGRGAGGGRGGRGGQATTADAAAGGGRSMTQPAPSDFGVKPDAPELAHHFGPNPVAPLGEKFGNVGSVAVAANGDLLVFNRNPKITMVEYDPTGTTVKKVFNPNIAINPHGMRVDSHGNIWVIDSYQGVIFKLDSNGDVLATFGSYGAQNTPWDDAKWNGSFNQPLDIAFDKDDNFYVVQSHGGTSSGSAGKIAAGSDPRVLKFDKTGKYITSAALTHPDGLYPTLHTVIVAPNGDVWVGDRHSRKIIVLDKDLKSRHEIAVPDMPCGFFADAKGQLWMSTGRDGRILKMGWDGKVQGWMGQIGTDATGIGEGHYVAIGKDGKTVWVADSTQAKVIHFVLD